MSSWPSVSLGSLISSIRGGTSYGGENRRPATGEVGILTLGAVGGDRFDPDACKALPAAILPHLGDPVRAGTMLMTRSNTIDLVGSVVYVDADHSDRFLPDLIWELSLHADAPLRPAFLADFLSTADGRRLLQSAAMGTSGSMKKLSMARLKRLKVPAVPMALQDAWLNVRNQIDRLQIHGRDLLTAKRAFKRALMNDLLTGLRRFPEFEGQPWIRRPLGHFLREKSLRNNGGRIQLVYSCSKLYGIIPQTDRFKHRVAARNVDNYKVVSQGDLVYDPMLLWDASLGFVPNGADGVVSPAYTTLTLMGSGVDRDFLAHALFGHRARHLYKTVSRGTNVRRKKVLASDFLRITLQVPPTLAEQQRVAELLDLCDTEIRHLAEQAARLAALKRGLMQRLLSGEIELPEHLTAATAAAEAADDDS